MHEIINQEVRKISLEFSYQRNIKRGAFGILGFKIMSFLLGNVLG